MNGLIRFYQRASNWKTILAAFIATAALYTLFGLAIVPRLLELTGGYQAPDIIPFYTLSDLRTFLASARPEGLAFYATRFFPVDLVFPLSLATFFCLTLAFLTRRLFSERSRWHAWVLFPWIGTIADYGENVGLVLAIRFPDAASDGFLLAVTWASRIKLVFGAGNLVLVAGFALAWTIRAMNSPKLKAFDRTRAGSNTHDKKL
ncbi:hypothetical protein [Saccharospirillum salsuginis]|uniref:Uncharacterized protein n=1 Tax=Saccharospirillum salsuginis TaxID=418750 RepID=A0A918KTH6_9GAMM|nr:hypothetical protein [Saccharospirillum salsuginis]GGX72942.1 hypothetical protein GCM10007392_45390 [Saccharospirillum salsuginis]